VTGGRERGLLVTLPSGRLLAGLVRLLVSNERREEFLGDLIEEAQLRRARSAQPVAAWLWSQVLCSAPALIGWRLRRLFTARPAPVGPWGHLLAGTRGRASVTPLMVAVSANALLLFTASAWVFWRVDELESPRLRATFAAALVPTARPVGQCLSCPEPRLPSVHRHAGIPHEVLVNTCVGAAGEVTGVDVLSGIDAAADASVVDTVRTWRMAPRLVDGRPVPFCYRTRFVFSSGR
jgi:TonB family protein